MTNNRTILHLSNEALATIDRNAQSAHKRGAWVSLAVVEYERLLHDNSDPTGAMERIDHKLDRLELTLNRILHESQPRQQRRLKPA